MTELMESDTPSSTRRHRRPATSCFLCRKKKIRCNKEIPCSNCIRSKNKDCLYEAQSDIRLHQRPKLLPLAAQSKRKDGASHCSSISQLSSQTTTMAIPLEDFKFHGPGSCAGTTLADTTSACELPEQTVDPTGTRAVDRAFRNPSETNDPYHIKVTLTKSGHLISDIHTTDRGIMSKTRLFGKTHWMNGAMLLGPMFESFEKLTRDKSSQSLRLLKECKTSARTIKAYRDMSVPLPSLVSLPTKQVADKLVAGYFRTTESLFRVLHIPSFQEEYDTFWSTLNDTDHSLATSFHLQLRLVMAIGAATYDREFSLRNSAIQWVQEAATWVAASSSKSRLNISVLQIMILLCLARETTGIGADLIWISSGSLLRTAISMGLHRDPRMLPRMSTFNAEMRRRLWNTTIEIAIQSSIDSGNPPLISSGDFDTEPPANFDDTQLVADNADKSDPSEKPSECYTQTSLAIALRNTLPVRLSIVKLLNDLRPKGPTYQDLLRLDSELRAAYRQLCRSLQGLRGVPTNYDFRLTDFIVRRYFLSLHFPWFELALHDASYAYTRRVVIDTASKLWQLISGEDDLARLSICAAGFFRSVPIQACLALAVELRAQLLEEESLGPKTPRPDLLAILHESKTWSFKRIEAGETNIKGHLSISALSAQVDAIAQGLSDDDAHQAFAVSTEEALHRCLSILQGTSHIANISDSTVKPDEGWEIPGAGFGVPSDETFFTIASDWLLDDTSPGISLW